MITDIPTPDDFRKASINLLHLAWEIAVRSVSDFEELADFADGQAREEATEVYWSKSQPALANALTVIQQAVELALKGRIAVVSPFLIITRDPKEYPATAEDTPFSSFRTIDAADLFRVHNGVCAERLTEEFRTFWEKIRRQRNTLMHSVAPSQRIDPGELMSHVFTANDFLHGDGKWIPRLVGLVQDDKTAGFISNDFERNEVMRQTELAVRYLEPAEVKAFIGIDPKRHLYLCPTCFYACERDYMPEEPIRLAQLTKKGSAARDLHCPICLETNVVVRKPCSHTWDEGMVPQDEQPIEHRCPGNVISDEGLCLTCGGDNENG